MLLAVAGLEEKQIDERTKLLASGDWSSFPAGERAAFAYARKLSLTPWDVSAADVDSLVRHFGEERAMDIVWWACRCHYMTRVADAFQLPLEKENVFRRQPAAPKKP
jgi:alkylhydroperoxidase family enzyme